MILFENTRVGIEKVLFSGDEGVVARRKITDLIFEIKAFIKERYPTYQRTNTVSNSNKKVGLLLGLLILVIPFFAIVTLKKGYSKRAKYISCIWFGLFILAIIFSPTPPKDLESTENPVEIVSPQK